MSHKYRVLIVEDDADLRQMLVAVMTSEGFDVAVADNGRDALDYLHTQPTPDVILLDLMMPTMNGWEFRGHQLQDRSLAGIPVVIMSALDANVASPSGVADYVTKPIDFTRLFDAIRSPASQKD